MAITIAVIAQKGGAGKSTMTVNLGAAIAATGRRVLLVDCDPQGSLGASLAVAPVKPTLAEVLAGDASAAAIRETGTERLALLPADLDLTDAESELPAHQGWYDLLREALEPLTGYDVILLDTPRGLGVLSFLALQASEHALIVCPAEFLAYQSLPQVLTTIERAQRLRPALRVLGIVPTLVSHRSRHEREVLAALATDHGALLLPEVPRRVALQESARLGRPVVDSAPNSDAAEVFRALADAVLTAAGAPAPSR